MVTLKVVIGKRENRMSMNGKLVTFYLNKSDIATVASANSMLFRETLKREINAEAKEQERYERALDELKAELLNCVQESQSNEE